MLFECSAGVRVITTLNHSGVHSATKVIAIVGIDDIDHQDVHCTLYNSKGSAYDGKEAVGVKVSLASVKPNEVWHWPDGYGAPAQLQRAAKIAADLQQAPQREEPPPQGLEVRDQSITFTFESDDARTFASFWFPS